VRLLLLRHAIAVSRSGFDGPDSDRPLTREGSEKFERGAEAIARLLPELDLIATSPWERARATARILVAALPSAPPLVELPALAHGGTPAEVVGELASSPRLARSAALALVGHEPLLSVLEAWLLAGRSRPFSALRKGGAALLEFDGAPRRHEGLLLWHLTAGQLRSAHR